MPYPYPLYHYEILSHSLELSFIRRGNYEEVISHYMAREQHKVAKLIADHAQCLLERLKDEDLPLFLSFRWSKAVLFKWVDRRDLAVKFRERLLG